MNARHREQRVRQAEDARDLALHNLALAREALDLIAIIAGSPLRHDSLRSIERLAHVALVGSTRTDPAFVPGEQHEGETP
ncbi:hypothetical protein [Paraburkholderia adhaesiva]|uniref:hypothetical protein n=1 Tax=Paraburkholderia adhaesiva TaxID=2883244 RepID=UPI001F35139C|nr:hypothetical protein [Paraburkholderia adhaesiva]